MRKHAIRYTPGPNKTLTEEPQGAEAAAWYTYQSYRAFLANHLLDETYALLMAEYHNDVTPTGKSSFWSESDRAWLPVTREMV